MPRRVLLGLLLCLWGAGMAAQDLGDIQIHGFATQGFLYSSHNNYLTMQSSKGDFEWTQGAISVTDPLSDKLRVGMQLHMYEMGQIGGPNVIVDWASGDYKVNDQVGFRAGKVKIPSGLYNDSQDVDAVFLWILLPQGMYPADNWDYDLAALGGEIYGGVGLGKRGGLVQYRGFLGESRLSSDGGYVQQLAEFGLTFPTPPGGRDFGGDVRWRTPWQGLTVGVSPQSQALDGTGPQGTVHMAPALLLAYYAEWTKGKWHVAGEYWRTPLNPEAIIGGTLIQVPLDERAWYPMVSYRAMKRLQVGSY